MFVFSFNNCKIQSCLLIFEINYLGSSQGGGVDDVQEIQRKVYFFKIEHFRDIKETILAAIRRIGQLKFDDNGRYKLISQNAGRLSAFPDSDQYPIKLRFGKTRHNGLPSVDKSGNVSNLMLDEDSGLIDICHLVIFDDGFVAAEWNHEGPKLAQLSMYMLEKGGMNTAPKFLPLVERDILSVVENLDSVRLLEIEIPTASAALVRQADENIYTAFKAAEELGGSKKVGLKLASEGGTLKLRDLARKLASIVKSNPSDIKMFNNLSVVGYSEGEGRSRFIDILEDKIVSTETFIRSNGRSKSICTDSAYETIIGAYHSNVEKMKTSAMMRGSL